MCWQTATGSCGDCAEMLVKLEGTLTELHLAVDESGATEMLVSFKPHKTTATTISRRQCLPDLHLMCRALQGCGEGKQAANLEGRVSGKTGEKSQRREGERPNRGKLCRGVDTAGEGGCVSRERGKGCASLSTRGGAGCKAEKFGS